MHMNTQVPVKPCPVRVVIRDDSNPDLPPIHDKVADHGDRFFRDWITKTTWWALRNGKSVSIFPMAEAL
jgi:hypothetical protein